MCEKRVFYHTIRSVHYVRTVAYRIDYVYQIDETVKCGQWKSSCKGTVSDEICTDSVVISGKQSNVLREFKSAATHWYGEAAKWRQ